MSGSVAVDHVEPYGLLAVKRRSGEPERERLRSEWALLRHARHPGVVEVVDILEDPERSALRTRFAGQRTVATCPLTACDLAAIGSALAVTLADLHLLGLSHRELTADHVILDRRLQPVLCGFGDAGLRSPLGDLPALGYDPTRDIAALGALLEQALKRVLPVRPWERAALRQRRAARVIAAIAAECQSATRTAPANLNAVAARLARVALAPSARKQAVASSTMAGPTNTAQPDSVSTVLDASDPISSAPARAVHAPTRTFGPRPQLPTVTASPAKRPSRQRQLLVLAGVVAGAGGALGWLAVQHQTLAANASGLSSSGPSTSDLSTTEAGAEPDQDNTTLVAKPDQPIPCPTDLAALRRDGLPSHCLPATRFTGIRFVVAGTTFELGEPGNVVALGDIDCDGFSNAAVLDLKADRVYLYERWPSPDSDLTAAASAPAGGATDLRTVQQAGCAALATVGATGEQRVLTRETFK